METSNAMIHLHCHTDYSNIRLIDCIDKIPKLIAKAVELGSAGIAITDHESVSGHVKAIKEVKRGKEKGTIPKDFKLILGNEIYLVDSLEEVKENYQSGKTKFWHFILLAKDLIGHKQLRELSSLAWDNSFYTGTMERTPTLKADLARIVGENPGHLIASTACLGGELPGSILDNDIQKANRFVEFCINVFGEENFFFELQPNDSEEQITVNRTLINISKQTGIKHIITCDVHYLQKEDRIFHEAYLKSHEEEREVGDFYKTTYLMPPKEIHSYLDAQIGEEIVDEGLKNTLMIGDMIEEYDLYHSTIVPGAEIPSFALEELFNDWYDICPYIKKFAHSDNVYDRYLLHLIEKGFIEKALKRGKTQEELEVAVKRIEVELSEMWKVTEKIQTSISSYYLSTLELIEIMWNEGDSLVGVARGSVTGMYTMYLIGLIQMDPIKWNLPHWRHISWQKAELSDVDIDTQRNRRTQIIEAVKKRRGYRKVLNACTFKTEGSKSAILTAARGMGIDISTAQYIANMIPITRGFTWPLSDCINGNVEEDRKPVTEFINEVGKIPGLLETAMNIEGLISGRSIHASAVYLFNEDFVEHSARMKAPNGTLITQFNMKDQDYLGGLKMDFLTISSLDSIRHCLDMLVESGHIKWQGTLRATYDKYIHPDVLDYDTTEMWDWVAKNYVTDLFQFNTSVGLQAAQRIKPHSLIELATANSIMRLMVSEPGAEQPIDTYIRYKNDISQWYACMKDEYHLTEEEIKIVEPYLLPVYGVGDTQEIVMELSMDEHISGFDVAQSNKLRKGIAKKDKELQAAMKKMFFEHGKEIGTSENLLNYIWKEVVGKQLGYSFSKNHTFPYSVIGLQELNLAYHYPIVYWNTACLIVNAGADEEIEENKSTDYGKIATAISNMQKRGIEISLPLINQANFGFIPDEASNRIIYSLKAINGIGDDVVRDIIVNRPYSSMEDFYAKMVDTKILTTSKIIQLIKAGCFAELDDPDRNVTMRNYLTRYVVSPVEKLTLSQFNRLMQFNEIYHIIPENLKNPIRHKYFREYILSEEFLFKLHVDENSKRKIPKCGYHDRWFKLDDDAMDFFQQFYSDDIVEEIESDKFIISEKKFIKENDKFVSPLKEWFGTEEAINQYNNCLYNEAWEKYASGTLSKWEMDSLSIYCNEPHELEGLDNMVYGIVDFFNLPEQPVIETWYTRNVSQEIDGKTYYVPKQFPKYKIVRLAGTVIDKNKDKHMVALLTTTGVVTLKFNKGQFLHYDKQITRTNPDGTTTTLEKSWFVRGNKILVSGYRNENQFRVYKYQDSLYKHTCHLVTEIYSNGTVAATTERIKID